MTASIEAPAYLLLMTEVQFQALIVQTARQLGWMHYHTYDSRGSNAGFPDLVLVKSGRPILYYEVKTEKGRVSMAQQDWLHAINHARGETIAMVVRPSDWDYIVEELSS